MIYFKWLNKEPLKAWLHSNADEQQLSAQQSIFTSKSFYFTFFSFLYHPFVD